MQLSSWRDLLLVGGVPALRRVSSTRLPRQLPERWSSHVHSSHRHRPQRSATAGSARGKQSAGDDRDHIRINRSAAPATAWTRPESPGARGAGRAPPRGLAGYATQHAASRNCPARSAQTAPVVPTTRTTSSKARIVQGRREERAPPVSVTITAPKSCNSPAGASTRKRTRLTRPH